MSFDIYVNEEGLLNQPDFMFQVKASDRISTPLGGNALLVGTNTEGESVSADPNQMINLEFSFVTKDCPNSWNQCVNYYKSKYGTSYGIEYI